MSSGPGVQLATVCEALKMYCVTSAPMLAGKPATIRSKFKL